METRRKAPRVLPRRSVPVSARNGTASLDGRPAVLVQYPYDAPFPWRRVTDEPRLIGEGILLGLACGIPGTPASGAPSC